MARVYRQGEGRGRLRPGQLHAHVHPAGDFRHGLAGRPLPPTRQQRIKRVEGDKVYLAACSVGETYVELYTEGGTMKARYRVDVQRYTPSITPTPSPTAPPTATATAMATPTDTCPRPPGQGVVALGLGQQTIRGRWDGNDCLHFPVTASTRLHIVLMLRSFGRDPEVSLLEGVGTGGAELAHNDDTLEGSGEESLLGRTVPAGGYTVRAEINRAPLSGSTYQLVIEAALKYAPRRAPPGGRQR